MARVFQKLHDTGIPIAKFLNAILIVYTVIVVFTMLWYKWLTDQEANTLRWACVVIFGYIIIFLSYSKDVRCVVTLAIPILCSSRGRSVVIAVAFFVAATGPTVNLFHNIDAMITSLTCGQMQLKQALSDMLDTLKKPIVAIKEAIQNAVDELRKVLAKVQMVLQKIEALLMCILTVMRNAFAWLRNIVTMCNKEFGTPFDRCIHISENAIKDCEIKLGPVKGLCQVTHVFTALCYPAKIVDVICVLVVFVNESIIKTVIEQLRAFTEEVKKMFDVSVVFEHDFYFKTTSSKELNEVREDIMKDIHRKMKTFIMIFGWLDVVSLMMLVFIIIKAIYFRMKYVHNPAYQNVYITKDFVDIDENRSCMNMETALPLKHFEKLKYVRLTDCMLTQKEWLGMARSSVFLTISSIQLFCICFTDYSLFWILALISYFGHKAKGVKVPAYISVEIEGGGFVGDIFSGIVHAFEPVSQNYTVDPQSCLPVPLIPNFLQYYLIGILCLLAWICLVCQPYGLRLRHIIMRIYYPDVARERAVWLYNRILLKRMSFFKLARRKARIAFTKDKIDDNFTWLDWLRAKTDNYWLCRLLLGKRKTDKCLLCSTPLKEETRVKCSTIGCNAVYCQNCYQESHCICCICNNPAAYGDLSDVSEVQDSSDDPDVIHIDETDDECLTKKWNQHIEK